MPPFDLVARPEARTRLDYWREHRVDTIVWPLAWVAVSKRHQLNWKKIRFGVDGTNVDEVRGIYSFVINIEAPNLPPHGYIVYVGITGHERERTLRERYGEYKREQRRGSKRPLIDDMLTLWKGHLDFWFSPVPDKSISLEAMEAEINSAIVTPYVRDDFLPEDRPLITKLRSR